MTVYEESAEELYEQAPCGYLSTAPDGTIVRVNETFLAWTGFDRDDLVGKRTFAQLLTPGGRIFHETHYAPLLRMQGSVREIAVDVVCADGRQLPALINSVLKRDSTGQPLVCRTTVFNASDRKQYERELVGARERAEREHRRAAFLLEAATVLAAASGLAETVERLAQVAVPVLGDICLIDVVSETGALTRLAARHADPARQPLVDRLRRHAPGEKQEHPVLEAMRDRTPRWAAEVDDTTLQQLSRDHNHLAVARSLGVGGYISVPLVVGDDVLGGMTLLMSRDSRRFTEADVALAQELAAQVALVVEKAQRFDHEHRTSHTLQSSLLQDRLPSLPGLSVAVRYLPGTRDVEVGGDFYDVLRLPSGQVAVTVGDVAGHDITAAATMGQLRSAARALVGGASGPGELIARLQDNWGLLDLDRMATAAFAWLHPGTGQLTVASAGHLPPLLVSDSSAQYLLVDPGGPLGAPVTPAAELSTTLPVGGTLLLYTDGLVEDRHQDIDVGLERLRLAALDAHSADPEKLCDFIVGLIAGEERSDDVALLAITRH